MNILLIYPAPQVSKECRFGYSLNLLYLAAILRREGHLPEYIDFSLDKNASARLHRLLDSADGLVVEFDSFPLKRSHNVDHAQSLIDSVRQTNPKIPIVAFGYDCILNPRQVSGADFTYAWEPEGTICKTLTGLTSNKRAVQNTFCNGELKDLDSLPYPARDLLTEEMLHGGDFARHPLAKSALVQTSRGCRNSCRFCQRKGWSKTFRAHSIDYTVGEFRKLRAEQITNVWIADDNFGFDLKRAKALLRALVAEKVTLEMKIALSSWIRIDHEFLDLARSAGVSIISFGLESADEEILRFYQKMINWREVSEILQYADSIGVYSVGNFIIGAPMETEQTIAATFELAMSLPLDQVNMKILTYMPGADLFNELAPEQQGKANGVFACSENGLNKFPFAYLQESINNFLRGFHISRKSHLARKLRLYGTPYILSGKHPIDSLACQ